MLLWVGTYTRKTESKGIYAFDVDPDCGEFRPLTINESIDNPSWLVAHPQLPVIYCVNEVADQGGAGGISALRHEGEGRLSLINRRSSLGADPCHLAVDPGGAFLMVANYTSGILASFPLEEDGQIGEFLSFVEHRGHGVDPMRQKSPHVHSVTLTPDGGHACVADLGVDKLFVYPHRRGMLDTSGRRAVVVKPGAGPRHFCFDGGGRYGYLINELDNTIISFERLEDDSLLELATVSTLPVDFSDASYCAHIAISADQRFLYGTNRGHDSVAVIALDGKGGMEVVQIIATGGSHPRHFALAPDDRFLLVANRDTSCITVFARDARDGTLASTGTTIGIPAPVCLLWHV